MAKLERITNKIFGDTATATGDNPQIGQFGSAKAGTYIGTTDIETIQALPAYSNGWIDAVTPDNKFPALPEMTGVHKVLSYQTGYLMQEGIPEWDAGTIYYTNSYCKSGNEIFISNTDNNIGKNPLSSTDWSRYSNRFLDSTKITNCLTEIPQRNKLELKDGILTLKAGSEIIIPNGFEEDGVTKKFIYEQLENDMSQTTTAITTQYLFPSLNNASLARFTNGNTYISDTSPAVTTSVALWYDLSENVFKVTSNTGNTWTTVSYGLPVAIATSSTDGFISIDQEFNGFGFLKNLFWVEKGVKGLIPNGRNEDGSLNNIAFVTDNTIIKTVSATFTTSFPMTVNDTNFAARNPAIIYDEKANYNMAVNGQPFYECVAVEALFTGGMFQWIKPKTTFHAVDWNEADTRYVNTTGDTMTGTLVIERNNVSPAVRGRRTDLSRSKTVAPTLNEYFSTFAGYDKDDNQVSYFRSRISTGNNFQSQMGIIREVNGEVIEKNITVGIDVNGKVSYSPVQLITTYVSGASGYNIWSNGYCEQWGRVNRVVGTQQISLAKKFNNTNYIVIANAELSSVTGVNVYATSICGKNVSNFTLSNNTSLQNATVCVWKACGYLATDQY